MRTETELRKYFISNGFTMEQLRVWADTALQEQELVGFAVESSDCTEWSDSQVLELWYAYVRDYEAG